MQLESQNKKFATLAKQTLENHGENIQTKLQFEEEFNQDD